MKKSIEINQSKSIRIIYFIFVQIGSNSIQIRLTINHSGKAVSKLSISFPAIHGIVNALIPKHCEFKEFAEPRYLIGEDFITASDADGRNIHIEMVRGMKAISINKYPSYKKFETDNKINPISNEIKHNLNLKGEFLFFKT